MSHLVHLRNKVKSEKKKRRKRNRRRSSVLLTRVETPVEDDFFVDVEVNVGEDYEKIQLLGKGATGRVFHIRNKKTGKDVAQKVVYVDSKNDKNRPLYAEVNVLKNCTSPHIIKLYEYFRIRNRMYLHLEYMDRGDLRAAIKRVRSMNTYIPERIISKICYSILMGLKYLKEQLWIVHRDVKPANILLQSNGQVKIGDLGMCGNIKVKNRTHLGTGLYMSPERFLGRTHHSNSDIWSLGIVAAECGALEFPIRYINAEDPWDVMEKMQIFQKTGNNKSDEEEEEERLRKRQRYFVLDCPDFSSHFSEEYKDFVSRALTYEKEDRPEASELLQHRFIRKYIGSSEERNCEELSKWMKGLYDVAGGGGKEEEEALLGGESRNNDNIAEETEEEGSSTFHQEMVIDSTSFYALRKLFF